MNEEQKKEYEISFLLTAPEAEKNLVSLLSRLGAEIYHQKPVAELRLAYKIKKYTSAYFGFCHFRALPEAIQEIKPALRLVPEVLRFLLVTPTIKLVSEQPPRPERKPAAPILSNEALSEKLEEILK